MKQCSSCESMSPDDLSSCWICGGELQLYIDRNQLLLLAVLTIVSIVLNLMWTLPYIRSLLGF